MKKDAMLDSLDARERSYDNSANGINFTIRKVNLMFVFIVVVWIFFFNKYMIQNPVFFVYNVIMLSIVYATVLWANFFVKLLMSSAKAAVNSFDECNVFEKASQLSVIVYDNKLNNSNDETFSILTVCNCRSIDTTKMFILIALVRMVFVFVIVNSKEKNYTYFEEIQESKTFILNLHQKKHTEVFSNASFYK